jgi:hypothetical protein
MNLPFLKDLPRSAQLAVVSYLLCSGVGYAYALGNVALKVGVTPDQVAVHYHGGSEAVPAPAAAPKKAAPGGEEALDLDGDAPVAAGATTHEVPAPSLASLVQEGHTHLFGQTSLFFAVVAVAMLLSIPERLKRVLAVVPFLAIVSDHLGFLATRYLGHSWAWLVMLSGATMALTHATVAALACWEVWRAPRTPSPEITS